MDYSLLPTINAILNATSGALVLLGYRNIRRGKDAIHKKFMLTAIGVSAIFLASYLTYHWEVGSIKFQGEGIIRIIYFSILISHTILAVVIVPMVLRTVYLALKGQFSKHQKIAKITFPIWVYVSATGVIVYLMLYQL
ncbi:MAG: DUF420 domain-containing protein [Candidatus Marinimicrobia bacterium]|nr:DUF420 domain-containing protein [Candidatus Neomarinimicrobiota bacterium]